jgi:hypothetical protein
MEEEGIRKEIGKGKKKSFRGNRKGSGNRRSGTAKLVG